MFALSDAHEYSFSQVPYLKWEEKKTDLSNFVNDEMLFQSMFLPPLKKIGWLLATKIATAYENAT